MKKILLTVLFIFSYNLFLLVLPILIFLGSLSFSSEIFIKFFPWIYWPFLFLSPILAIYLGLRIAIDKTLKVVWFTTIIINFLGYSPFILIYFLLNSLWNLFDYLLLVSFPISLGLCANLAGKLAKYYSKAIL